MRKTIIALAAAAVAAPAFAADSYTIDPRHTFPYFEVSHHGFSLTRGRFDKTSGKITLDRAAKTGTVDIAIDPASISMGIAKFDEVMRSDEFFNVEKFPAITFKSTSMTFQGEDPALVIGNLTMLGVTRPVPLTITGFKCAPHPINKKELCGADVQAVVKRTEFGMTKYAPNVGDDVRLLIQVEAFKD